MLPLILAALIAQAPPSAPTPKMRLRLTQPVPKPAEATPAPRWQARPGEHAEIRVDGVLACEFEVDLDDLNRFLKARDLVGIRKLLAEGEAVPLARGTQVLVISVEDRDRPGSPVEVRVQGGRFAGRKLFVAEPNLGRVQPARKPISPLSPQMRRRLEKRRRAGAAIDALSRPAAPATPPDPFD